MNPTARRANYPLRAALAQSVALTLQPEQLRFLALHAHASPWKHFWFWGSTQLRAETERGEHATISAPLFDELVRLRLVRRSGVAGAVITKAGRAAV